MDLTGRPVPGHGRRRRPPRRAAPFEGVVRRGSIAGEASVRAERLTDDASPGARRTA